MMPMREGQVNDNIFDAFESFSPSVSYMPMLQVMNLIEILLSGDDK